MHLITIALTVFTVVTITIIITIVTLTTTITITFVIITLPTQGRQAKSWCSGIRGQSCRLEAAFVESLSAIYAGLMFRHNLCWGHPVTLRRHIVQFALDNEDVLGRGYSPSYDDCYNCLVVA